MGTRNRAETYNRRAVTLFANSTYSKYIVKLNYSHNHIRKKRLKKKKNLSNSYLHYDEDN